MFLSAPLNKWRKFKSKYKFRKLIPFSTFSRDQAIYKNKNKKEGTLYQQLNTYTERYITLKKIK